MSAVRFRSALIRRVGQSRYAKGQYKTEECRNIAIGHAITALGTMETEVKRSPIVLGFVRRQTENTRAGNRKKAKLFLKKNRGKPPTNIVRRTASPRRARRR